MRRRSLLLLVFALSGALCIQYEVLWLRFVTQLTGSNVQSISAVITAFLLGLGLGALAFGRIADRVARPLLLYALLELGVGLAHALAYLLFLGLDDSYATLFALIPYDLLQWLLYGLAILLISLPAALIGASVPVMLRVLVTEEHQVHTQPARLYALNTFGGACGALSLAFLILPRYGYVNASLGACLASLLLGLIVVLPGLRVPGSTPAPARDAPSRGGPRRRLLAFFLSGFAALGFEVLAARLLLFLFKGSLVSFALLLFLFLSGLALGSFAHLLRPLCQVPPRLLFGRLQIGLGFSLLLTTLLLCWFSVGAYFFVLVFLISSLLGLTFPVAVEMHHRSLARFGGTLGEVYSANTLGSIAGAFLTGFVLIPWLGTQSSLLLIASLQLGLGGVFCSAAEAAPNSRRLLRPATLWLPAAALLLIMLLPTDLIWRRWFAGRELLHLEENATEVVSVLAGERGARTLYGGPFISGSTRRREVQTLQGHLPMLLHPDPRTVLEIGYGTGEILKNLALYRPEHVALIELDGAMIATADRYFERLNQRVSERPFVETHLMDGRHFLAQTGRRFDVVLSDTFFINSELSCRLYTENHFRAGRRRLTRDGIMLAWVPLTMGNARVELILRTFFHVFPETLVWQRRHTLFLLGFRQTPRFDLERLSKRFDALAANSLAPLSYESLPHLLAGFRLGRRSIEALLLARPGPLHRDLVPVLDFTPEEDFHDDGPLGRALLSGSARVLLPYMDSQDADRLRPMIESYERARTELERGRPGQDSPDQLEALLELSPQLLEARLLHSEIWEARGLVKLETDPLAAAGCFEKSLTFHPYQEGASYHLGRLLERRADIQGALAHYRRCLVMMPYFKQLEQRVERLQNP